MRYQGECVHSTVNMSILHEFNVALHTAHAGQCAGLPPAVELLHQEAEDSQGNGRVLASLLGYANVTIKPQLLLWLE